MRIDHCVLTLSIGLIVSLSLVAEGDVNRGRDIFQAKCIGCHAIACHRAGPKLEALFGRQAGSVPDFTDYSDALKQSGIVWSEKTLDAFLTNPNAMVPGTLMAYAGKIEDAQKRRDVIDFLKSADTSLDICL